MYGHISVALAATIAICIAHAHCIVTVVVAVFVTDAHCLAAVDVADASPRGFSNSVANSRRRVAVVFAHTRTGTRVPISIYICISIPKRCSRLAVALSN